MQEFATVSSSSYDPASLATKLTEKSSEGWTIVAIVPTGGDVTAFLSREGGSVASAPAMAEAAPAMAEAAPAMVEAAPTAPEPPAAEPAGWAVAPEAPAYTPAASSAPATVISTPAAVAPIDYSQQQPAQAYTPQPAYAPVAAPAATPAVPAGWYADPAGRFELRYWDGGTWTEHVSTGGVQSTNPPVA